MIISFLPSPSSTRMHHQHSIQNAAKMHQDFIVHREAVQDVLDMALPNNNQFKGRQLHFESPTSCSGENMIYRTFYKIVSLSFNIQVYEYTIC